jgi:hypothetical protein
MRLNLSLISIFVLFFLFLSCSQQLHIPPLDPIDFLICQPDFKMFLKSLQPLLLGRTSQHQSRLSPIISLNLPINKHNFPHNSLFFRLPSQKPNNQHRTCLEIWAPRLTREKVHNFKIRLEKLHFRKCVEGVPVFVFAIAILIDPKSLGLFELLWDRAIYETDFLCSKVLSNVLRDKGKGFGWSVPTESDIQHPSFARCEGDDVHYVNPTLS